MSVGEAAEAINAANRRQARFIYQNALLSGIAVNNPAAFPQSLSCAFPKLFGNAQTDWRESREFMKSFQKKNNELKREAKKEKNDG